VVGAGKSTIALILSPLGLMHCSLIL
ncbi:unnamed protein product, partial [Rotaria magnacalcarata]